MRKQNGSVLVLTMMAVLVLSLLVTGLLTVGTTELTTTGNFFLNRQAMHTALEGVEDVRLMIYNASQEGTDIAAISRSVSQTTYTDKFKSNSSYYYSTTNTGVTKCYMTGSMIDWQNNTPVTLEQFGDNLAVTPPGYMLNQSQGNKLEITIWRVPITARVLTGNRYGFSEVVSGISSISITGY